MFRMSSREERDAIAAEWRRRLVRHPLYQTWRGMKSRCESPTCDHFGHYGARGIRVCERWTDDFCQFSADAGVRPSGMTVDRIDSLGNYEPGNCRWATKADQQRNKRSNISHQGKCVAVWAREMGMPSMTLRSRVLKWGWQKALATPWKPIKRSRKEACFNIFRTF